MLHERSVNTYDYNDGAWDWPADNTYTASLLSAEWLQVFSLKNVDTLTIGVNYEKGTIAHKRLFK